MSYKLIAKTDSIETLTVGNKLIKLGEEFDATPEEVSFARRFFEIKDVNDSSSEVKDSPVKDEPEVPETPKTNSDGPSVQTQESEVKTVVSRGVQNKESK